MILFNTIINTLIRFIYLLLLFYLLIDKNKADAYTKNNCKRRILILFPMLIAQIYIFFVEEMIQQMFAAILIILCLSSIIDNIFDYLESEQ